MQLNGDQLPAALRRGTVVVVRRRDFPKHRRPNTPTAQHRSLDPRQLRPPHPRPPSSTPVRHCCLQGHHGLAERCLQAVRPRRDPPAAPECRPQRLASAIPSLLTTTDFALPGFRSSPASAAAQNFQMPALSPTMTEGNIASWKIKEGTKRITWRASVNGSAAGICNAEHV